VFYCVLVFVVPDVPLFKFFSTSPHIITHCIKLLANQNNQPFTAANIKPGLNFSCLVTHS